MPPQHILQKARQHGARIAIRAPGGREVSYHELCVKAARLSRELLRPQGQAAKHRMGSLKGERVAYLLERSPAYVMAQWGVWSSGGIAVPLHPGHPAQEMRYMVETSGASRVITNQQNLAAAEDACQGLRLPIHLIEEVDENDSDNGDNFISSPADKALLEDLNPQNFAPHQPAQILFTSGTTGRAKGVVATHQNILAQTTDIIQAWEISQDDSILHFLPLHHVHGILNKLLVPLYAGGTVHMLASSRPEVIWKHVGSTTVLMAVPTLYANLLEWYHHQSSSSQAAARAAVQQLRLCVSGSMSCPVPILQEWQRITGHTLLERYGMTELGMVLTNPLQGTRHAGYVGRPFPSVQVKLAEESSSSPPSSSLDTNETTKSTTTKPKQGELLVKGDTVFDSYWNRPDATQQAFDDEGWFQTGDWVEFCPQRGYKILGRLSADIFKVGGYKISAVEIEATVLEVDGVAECFVVGAPDEKWGQRIVAVVRLLGNKDEKEDKQENDDAKVNQLTQQQSTRDQREQDAQRAILEYAASKLAKYKLPRQFVFLDTIPKNAMGKVNKKQLLADIQDRIE